MYLINFILLLLVTIINGFAQTQLNTIPYDGVSYKGLVPWIGVLRVQHGDGQVALTGIVLIHDAVAIGNAFDVSKIYKVTLRNTTKAMFYDKIYRAWYYNVTDYILHPEFEKNTVNTIALVFLENKKKTFKWHPIKWPTKEKKEYHSVFNIGYTDRKKVLEQISYKMIHVRQSDCIQFYQKEGIDFKIIWPTYYRCYVNKHAKNTCVFDAGAALITNYTGTWKLLGLSIQGPGCSLPSRYIDVLPYVPWITSKLPIDTRRTESGQKEKNGTAEKNESLYSVDSEDFDTFYLAKIDDNSMVLRPSPNATETIHGCNGTDGIITYRDFNKFDLPNPAVGIYVLSHLDTIFHKYNCIMMNVFNAKKSESKFWLDKGFHQEDIGLFLKKIPLKNAQGQYLPRIVYVEDTWKKYEVYQTANLMFRFELAGQSWFDVKFYGDPVKNTSKTPMKHYQIRATAAPPSPRYIQ